MKPKDIATRAFYTTIELGQQMYVSYCNSATRNGKTTASGGTLGTLFANATMQAILFVPYEYETNDPVKIPAAGAEAATARTVDDNIKSTFFNNGNPGDFEIVTVTNNSPIQSTGWKTSLTSTSSKYINDLSVPTGTKPETLWQVPSDRKKFTVNGVYMVYVAAPSSLAGKDVELKARYKLQVGGGYTSSVTLRFNTFSISKDNLEIKVIESRGTSGVFVKLYTLRYKADAVSEAVKLLGIAKSGKYGITIGTTANNADANMLLTCVEDGDARVAAFFDGTFSSDKTKITIGIYSPDKNTSVPGTDYRSGSSTSNFYCDGGSWNETHSFQASLVKAAFDQGIPMAFVRKEDGYKLRYNNVNGSRILFTTDGNSFHAFDNCGNKISMTIYWNKYDWNNAPNWDNVGGKMPVVITAATHLVDGMGTEVPS